MEGQSDLLIGEVFVHLGFSMSLKFTNQFLCKVLNELSLENLSGETFTVFFFMCPSHPIKIYTLWI